MAFAFQTGPFFKPISVSTVRLANWVSFGSIYRFETACVPASVSATWQFVAGLPASVSAVRLANWVSFGSIYRFETASWHPRKPTLKALKLQKWQIRPTVLSGSAISLRSRLCERYAAIFCGSSCIVAPFALQTCSILGLYTVSKLLRGRLDNPQKALKSQTWQIKPPVPASASSLRYRICQRHVAIFWMFPGWFSERRMPTEGLCHLDIFSIILKVEPPV